ncbi:MAG: hypothetical protein J7K94_06465 [Dehalococcoidia bacterium]|nr:hypothetical protein [Dehalococcoidia bacterium]
MTTRKLSRDAADTIQQDYIHGVVNAVTGERTSLKNAIDTRHAVAEKGIPCLTALNTIRATSGTSTKSSRTFSLQPSEKYLVRRSLS